MKILTLKNSQLEALGKALTYKIPFVKSRIKNRFVELVSPKVEQLEKNRLELCKEFAVKDDNGEPKIANNSYMFPLDSKFDEEYKALFNEDCLIDIPDSMIADLGTIKQIIEQSEVEVDLNETAQIEQILAAFDALTDKPKKKK